MLVSVISITWFYFYCRLKQKPFVYLEKWKKSEFRAVIKHLYLEGLTSKEIKAELGGVHGTSQLLCLQLFRIG